MKTTTTTATILRDAADYMDYAKKRTAAIRKNSKAATATLDMLNRRCALVDEDRATMYAWPEIDAYFGTMKMQVMINATTDSMIEGIVPQILKAMLDIECEPVSSRDEVNAIKTSRIYRFTRAPSDHFLAISVTVEITIQESDAGTCRKIQTGTKMVEVAEYKIECDGIQAS
jgi:hypothetical protein